MPFAPLPGAFASWYGAACLLWLLGVAAGLTFRRSASPLLVLLAGGGALLALGASFAGDARPVLLPLPLSLGAARFEFVPDGLSRWFLALIGGVGAAVTLYAPGYLRHLRGRVAPGWFWAAWCALLASMTGVVLAANALVFLVAWEVMALASCALVAADHEQHAVRQAALIYLGAARVGTAFLMGGFLWAHQLAGTWDFSGWRIAGPGALGPALLILVGLATKAGSWPFHLWLPVAHPAAPAPVSALMSGVMLKTAVYALARLLLGDHFTAPALGSLILALGSVSAFWGVLFALLQRDLKRLLAYSSVENIGIILMALGLANLGRQLRLTAVAELALAAALLHCLNHAVFKSLLFLSAGAVDAQAHTRDLEQLGGLVHRMRWTALFFVLGSAAICGLPPLNGFAGEWLLYQGLFRLAAGAGTVGQRLGGLLLLGWLALVGALALACFVRAAGVVFLGQPRSPEAAHAREAGRAMTLAQGGLAAACLLLGLSVTLLLRPLGQLTEGFAGSSSLRAAWSLPLLPLFVALAGLLVLIAGWMNTLARARPSERFITWECGFGELGPRTQYSAGSFAQPVARLFSALTRYRVEVTLEGRDRRHFPETITAATVHEPYLETRLYTPLVRLVQRGASTLLMRLQAGSVHQYLLYMTLFLSLLLWLGRRP